MSKQNRRLSRWVEVDGTWYGPDSPVPDDIAAKITNPKVWADDGRGTAGDTGGGGGTKTWGGTREGARLARHVDVAGTVYGPDDHVPDNIAEKITNVAAWADRKLPPEAARTAREQAGQRHASTPPAMPGSGPPAERAGSTGDGGDAAPGPDSDDGGPPDSPPGPDGDEPAAPARKATRRGASF